MKQFIVSAIKKGRDFVSVRKLVALVVGAGLLTSSFFLGVNFANRERTQDTSALEENLRDNKSPEDKDDVAVNDNQQADLSTSATVNDGTGTAVNKDATGTVVQTASISKQFTLATLVSFNGQNGAKSYIAYNGKIYDVSNSPYFANGVHKYDSSVKAGTDITAQMNYSPSSHTARNYIGTLPEVGILVKTITSTTSQSGGASANNGGTSGNSTGTTSSSGSSSSTTQGGSQVPQFTLSTLTAYNGLNGAKAYIAYSGKVYDVSNSTYFVNGVHRYDSSVKAGTDITVQMNSAPSSHTSRNYIATLPQVGVLVATITNSTSTSGTTSSYQQPTPAITMAPGDDDDEDDEEDDD